MRSYHRVAGLPPLRPPIKREGAYGCCLDLIASQNTSEIAKYTAAGAPLIFARLTAVTTELL